MFVGYSSKKLSLVKKVANISSEIWVHEIAFDFHSWLEHNLGVTTYDYLYDTCKRFKKTHQSYLYVEIYSSIIKK